MNNSNCFRMYLASSVWILWQPVPLALILTASRKGLHLIIAKITNFIESRNEAANNRFIAENCKQM